MSQKKMRALKPGSKIAVLSPASTPPAAAVESGMAALRALGYNPIAFPHVLDHGPLYFAGPAAGRLDDLHRAFADKSIDAVHCARGGYGSVELLPLLNAKLISDNPKPFIGYSDVTSLHIYLQKYCGLVTFHGPMVASDFSSPNGADMTSFNNCLVNTNFSPWGFGAADIKTLRPGKASGTLRGGCLSIVEASLGTPFAPDFDDCILFLEDVDEPPFRIDRMLMHLKFSGKLQKVRGFVFGIMKGSIDPKDTLDDGGITPEAAIMRVLADFNGPIAYGLHSGHVSGHNITLPFGVAAELDLTNAAAPQFTITQPSVGA